MKSIKPIKEFIIEFLNENKIPADKFKTYPLAGDGSKRSFHRLIIPETEQSFIVMENYPVDEAHKKENISYLMIGNHLFNKGFPLPEIHNYDPVNGLFIMQDFGDICLQDKANRSKDRFAMYVKILDILLKLQVDGALGFNTDNCYQTKYYDISVMRENEAYYFRDSFLVNYLGMKDTIPDLETSFKHLFESASIADNNFFMHRDFQSRNIILTEKGFGIIDWQGARLGPLAYDLASLLIDPYVELSLDERRQLYGYYLRSLSHLDKRFADNFEESYPYIALLRNLQILGAFSYLSKVPGKNYFERYIPIAVKSLFRQLHEISDSRLSALTNLVKTISRYYGIDSI
jgi:aminoglycoside/choline kinase family phosphotransferase